MDEYVVLPGREASSLAFEEAVAATPRNLELIEAGWRTIARGIPFAGDCGDARLTMILDHSPPDAEVADAPEPYYTLVKVFSSYGRVDRDEFAPLTRYLERVCPAEGTILWRQDDESDGLYIVESGVLRATYQFGGHTRPTEESMVPGTLAGELSALSGLTRNTTCIVERQAVLWKLSRENLQRLEEEEPKLAREFTRLVLRGKHCASHMQLRAGD